MLRSSYLQILKGMNFWF